MAYLPLVITLAASLVGAAGAPKEPKTDAQRPPEQCITVGVEGKGLACVSVPTVLKGATAKKAPKKAKGAPLDDWGKLYPSGSRYDVVEPASTAEMQSVIRSAYQQGRAVRIRGRGHSMNGNSLPRNGELLVRTGKLTQFAFTPHDTVRVGTGLSVTGVQMWVSRYGYSLPLDTDGQIGPSIGGWINAGGFGTRSTQVGGFWANVAALTLVDGTGAVKTLKPTDPLFRWVFGSMGQLGVVTEVELPLVRIGPPEQPNLPRQGSMHELWEDSPEFAKTVNRVYEVGKLYWFTVFSPVDQQEAALQELEKIRLKYPKLLQYRPSYKYVLKNRGFNPPLIYPRAADLSAVGLWGDLAPGADKKRIFAMERDFKRMLERHPDFRRYAQAEVLTKDFSFEEYWGPAIAGEFRAWKKQLDPKGLFNPGVLRP